VGNKSETGVRNKVETRQIWSNKFKEAQDDGVDMVVCFVITKKILFLICPTLFGDII
jgi:hypothetical protein